MKANWLLEANTFQEGVVEKMKKEIKRQGMDAKMISCEHDESGLSEKLYNKFSFGDCVVFYGSLNLGRMIAGEMEWSPGVFGSGPMRKFACLHYYAYLGKHLLNQHYTAMPFGELLRKEDYLFDTFGSDDCLFIRPNDGFKSFTGEITTRRYYETDVKLMGFYDVKPHNIVIVAQPKNIEKEWRLVIVNKKVITGSEYKLAIKQDHPIAPNEIITYAQEVVDDIAWEPYPAWVMDVCQTKDKKLHVVEINSFNCSALYGGDIEAIIREVSNLAIEEWEVVWHGE